MNPKCILSFLVFFGTSNPGIAETNLDCEVSANFMMAYTSGALVSVTASDNDGTEWLTWMHSEPGVTYEFDGDPNGAADGVSCNMDEYPDAHFISEGDIMVNGVAGYSAVIDLEDTRKLQTTDTHICASLAQRPRTQNDGSEVYDPPRTVTIPYVLPVLVGSAGTGLVKLQMDDIRCRYRGDGTNYVFVGCGGPGGVEMFPGEKVDVSQLGLRVQTADRSYPVTSVRAQLGIDSPGPATTIGLKCSTLQEVLSSLLQVP